MMVSIIVPCYNEEEALPYFMREIRRTEAELSAAYGCTFELLFVDDGSKDRTLECCGALPGTGCAISPFPEILERRRPCTPACSMRGGSM